MYKLIRPLIFKASSDPENAHRVVMRLLSMAGGIAPLSWVERRIFDFADARLAQTIFGLNFKNPVGLAGGFDKNAEAVQGLANLGFGFLEIGTITRHGQPGNPRPRIFRLEQDEALINRMGFNNEGADVLASRLSTAILRRMEVPLGINIGKSKITELAQAAEDYLYSFKKLYGYGDYFVINVSSPNTPGLRQLQDKSFLIDILSGLNNYRVQQKIRKPILVKTVVDLSLEALDEVLDVCKNQNIDGLIISNTLLSRDGLKTKTNEAGGLSGKPIRQKSTDYIKHIHQHSSSLPIVGVGGIFSAEDAYEKIKAGASLVQIYTGLIYEGPGVVKKINRGLVKLLERDGFKNIGEAVGVEVK
jgi:dihydroorotate dehydrogenase